MRVPTSADVLRIYAKMLTFKLALVLRNMQIANVGESHTISTCQWTGPLTRREGLTN